MSKDNFTLVTGLWDLGRGELKDFGRSFDHYLECFGNLLSLDCNMIIWAPKELNRFINLNRNMSRTRIVNKELHEFDDWFPWFEQVQTTRKNLRWRQQADWLANSPQAQLKYYNPIVMSKFFMMNDSVVHDSFNSDYLFWIDAGLTNTVGIDLLRNVDRLPVYMKKIEEEENKKFLFLSYPYDTDGEVHGYNRRAFDEICGEHATYVCRGGFFGGHKDVIRQSNGDYYGIASQSFTNRVMGTEENFHTILSYKHKERFHRFELDDNGLVYKFFEQLGDLKKPVYRTNVDLIPWNKRKDVSEIKTSLYILSFNSPEQFARVAQSWLDNGFDKCHRRILINNSTDPTTYEQYQQLCDWFYFEHIKKEENVGICGGRQFVAEHFNESDSEYYLFIEDDMFLNDPTDEKDTFGYPKYIENLYDKSLTIAHQNHYDFLKLTYCEFYGDNSVQWSWYNIPQAVREIYFPDYCTLPEMGLDPNAPKVEGFTQKRYKDLHYLEGPYHYCNWPIWFSRQGNRKVFLNIKWANPFEQTWMSNAFQLQMHNEIKSAVLELSPITHDRFEFYTDERKES